jgi:large subunit ribosomal protein L21
MYAVVRTGGKQLRVAPGDVVSVEQLQGAPGDRVELDDVLLISEDTTRIGTPRIEGAKVVGTIQEGRAGPKLRIFKHKRRKGYRLHKGHRQHYTCIKIESIEG